MLVGTIVHFEVDVSILMCLNLFTAVKAISNINMSQVKCQHYFFTEHS